MTLTGLQSSLCKIVGIMASLCLSNVLVVALFACLQIENGWSLYMGIQPQSFREFQSNFVFFTCRTDLTELEYGTKWAIALTRGGNQLALFGKDTNNITFDKDINNRLKGEGALDQTGAQSFLTVSLENPRAEDSGPYSCEIWVSSPGKSPFLRHKTDMKLSVHSLNDYVNALMRRIVAAVLKIDKQNQTAQVIKDQAFFASAFTAQFTKSSFKPRKYRNLLFDNVTMAVGAGRYDPKSGFYYAPRDGLYAFHVLVDMNCYRCSLVIHIRKNNKEIVAIMHEGQKYKGYHDQSPMNVLVKLKKGERISTYLRYITSGKYITGGSASSFSGYLIRPL